MRPGREISRRANQMKWGEDKLRQADKNHVGARKVTPNQGNLSAINHGRRISIIEKPKHGNRNRAKSRRVVPNCTKPRQKMRTHVDICQTSPTKHKQWEVLTNPCAPHTPVSPPPKYGGAQPFRDKNQAVVNYKHANDHRGEKWNKADPSRAKKDASRGGQCLVAPNRTTPLQINPTQLNQVKPHQVQTDSVTPSQVNPIHTPNPNRSSRIRPDQAKSHHVAPTQAKPAQAKTYRTDSIQAKQSRTMSYRADQSESTHTDPK